MGLRINQNIAAQNAYRNLSVTDSQMAKSLEKLSSGFRINRASDDAAGLSISEGLRSQTSGLKVAVRNTQDGVSVAQTAEGSLNESTAILQRMRDLAVQTSNAGSMDSDAKDAANKELQQLNQELDRIGSTTSFGKAKLLDGSFGATAKVTGSATLNATDVAALSGTAGTPGTMNTADTTFVLEKVDGAVPASGPITVTVKASDIAAGASAQDIAKAVNNGISAALKGAGYQGNELQMTASTDSKGATTFSMSGVGDFELSGAGAGDLDALKVTTGGVVVVDPHAATPTGPAAQISAVAGGNTGRFQVGANANERIGIAIGAIDSKTLGTAALDLTANGGPDAAIKAIDSAIRSVSDTRANLGAYQNRFEHTINNLNVAVENLSASESRIRDTDVAAEMVTFTRNQILTQAGTSMLSQANQSAQGVLSLLR
ncbi:flagellin [Actinoplanes regularis]|uniref:flagellin N-terminal helical domain-containing protein n=1 Tax=Actinoplanes regularis TaxID=52697 RepID=UPI0024A464C3|nr:flagellin [Actinoplanes regularis]GLW35572.1 flagellin [Actinoplanes regularis]